MNTPPPDGYRPQPSGRAPIGPGEDTLRLVAGLPAPDGLADRVRAGLHSVPRANRILIWSEPLWPRRWMYTGLVRGCAAAAIVGVVAGGAWRIYSHVPPAPSAVTVPVPVSSGNNGFNIGGARRIPETLQGPVLNHPPVPPPEVNTLEKAPADSKPALPAPVKKKKALRKSAPPPQ